MKKRSVGVDEVLDHVEGRTTTQEEERPNLMCLMNITSADAHGDRRAQ